jgi:hypothetical protein
MSETRAVQSQATLLNRLTLSLLAQFPSFALPIRLLILKIATGEQA